VTSQPFFPLLASLKYFGSVISPAAIIFPLQPIVHSFEDLLFPERTTIYTTDFDLVALLFGVGALFSS
jgi:hypothetical protein